MEKESKVYVGLGGNIGDALATLQSAVSILGNHPCIQQLTVSRYYLTTPVSPLPQNPYINAVCQLFTTLSLHSFFELLQEIEKFLGKRPKIKSAPRHIDLDLLIFGLESCGDDLLTVPHPEWQNRLFVLKPLHDVTTKVVVPIAERPGEFETIDLNTYIQAFSNPNREVVRVLASR